MKKLVLASMGLLILSTVAVLGIPYRPRGNGGGANNSGTGSSGTSQGGQGGGGTSSQGQSSGQGGGCILN